MAHLFQIDRIKHLCTCGMLNTITESYYCRCCVKIRCNDCVSHEIDSLYCPSCLEIMASTEARLKKNRCANCYDCPSCGQTLSVRTTSVAVQSLSDNINAEDKEKSASIGGTRKVYYLGCAGCRWTTRDINMPDQNIGTGGWGDRDHPEAARLSQLFESFRALGLREKADAEPRRDSSRHSHRGSSSSGMYPSLADKYSIGSAASPLASRKSLLATPIKGDVGSAVKMCPSEAVEEVDGPSDSLFSDDDVHIEYTTNVDQRLWSPEWQPSEATDLFPAHKHLVAKRSLRCRYCGHIVLKPEFYPGSIKFKIKLVAYYLVPEIRIMKEVPLQPEEDSIVELSLCNPTAHRMTVALLPFCADACQHYVDNPPSAEGEKASWLMRVASVEPTAEVLLPQGQVVLAPKDDTAEFDDSVDDGAIFNDDPEVVVWRRANKVGVRVTVRPSANATRASIAFVLRFEHTNAVVAAAAAASDEETVPKTVNIDLPVLVDVGLVTQ